MNPVYSRGEEPEHPKDAPDIHVNTGLEMES